MLSNKTLPINHNNIPYGFQYASANGVFFVYNPKTKQTINIHDCRELFSWNFRNTHRFVGFNSSEVNIKSFNEFWEIIEDKLNLQEKSIIHFLGVEKNNNVFVIELSPFWLENHVRKNLLTLLIRCGANYYNGNFDKAINSYTLSNMTATAIKYFLKGHTQPTFKKFTNGGFVSKFHSLDEYETSQLLVKP